MKGYYSMETKKQRMLVILGPTASGKSDLAVDLARKFGGEIISADSRQVYRGLNIGTGKITKSEMRGVMHHLLDVASPRNSFTAADFKKKAERAIADIAQRGKLPILCGGTGFYIQSIVDNIAYPKVPPNRAFRACLARKSAQELFTMLKKLDARRAREIDRHNTHRLIRAIEIANELGSVPHLEARLPSGYNVLQIGIKTDDKILKEKIYKRLLARIKQGMINEAKNLHKKGLSWKRMEGLGLEYRFLAQFLRGKITKDGMIEKLNTAIWQYARRQKTWFKRDKRIKWFMLNECKKIEKEVEKFLKN